MVEHSKGSSERLTKLILSVKKVDEQARVKDSWHIVCSCGQTVKLNYEYNLGRFREHRMHSRCGLQKGQLGITSFFAPTKGK